MEILAAFIDIVLHLDVHLESVPDSLTRPPI